MWHACCYVHDESRWLVQPEAPGGRCRPPGLRWRRTSALEPCARYLLPGGRRLRRMRGFKRPGAQRNAAPGPFHSLFLLPSVRRSCRLALPGTEQARFRQCLKPFRRRGRRLPEVFLQARTAGQSKRSGQTARAVAIQGVQGARGIIGTGLGGKTR